MRIIYVVCVLLVISYASETLSDKLDTKKILSYIDIFLINQDENSSDMDDKEKNSAIYNQGSYWNPPVYTIILDKNGSYMENKEIGYKKKSSVNNNPNRDSDWNPPDFYIIPTENNDSNNTVIEEERRNEK